MLTRHKKIIAFLLAMMMALPSVGTVFAEEDMSGLEEQEQITLAGEEEGEEEEEGLDEENENEDANLKLAEGDGQEPGQEPLENDEEEGGPILIEGTTTLDEEAFTVSGIEDVIYDGASKTFSIVITNSMGEPLEEGEDYTVTYANNTKVGTATVTITGINKFEGEIVKEFRICSALEEKGSIADIEALTYTGKKLKPAVTVKYGKKTLVKNTDYTVKYENNVDAGKATVIVTGKGKYLGTLTKDFTIKKAKNVITAKDIRVNFSAKKQTVDLNITTKDPEAKITLANACYHDGNVAVILFNKEQTKAQVPEKFVGTEKVKIKVGATKNYKGATKVIKIIGVIDEFPYKSTAHVYKKVSTIGNALISKIHKRQEKFRMNANIATSVNDPDGLVLTIGAYAKYHQSKKYPYLIEEYAEGQPTYGKLLIGGSYNGRTYETLSFKNTFKMSLKTENALTKSIQKKLKSIGATKGTNYEKTKKIYKWITKNIRYAYKTNGEEDHANDSVYKAFKTKKATDKGYARLMKAMCNIAGIDCLYVENGVHAWVMVKNGKKWFQCDPCWDAGRPKANWLYFMKPYTKAWKAARGDEEIYPGYYLYNTPDIALDVAQKPDPKK